MVYNYQLYSNSPRRLHRQPDAQIIGYSQRIVHLARQHPTKRDVAVFQAVRVDSGLDLYIPVGY
jgi:hypothetical protein